MSRFDVFLIGNAQSLPLEIDADNLECLARSLGRQRFLLGRFSTDAEGVAMRPVMIPISRINLLCEAEL